MITQFITVTCFISPFILSSKACVRHNTYRLFQNTDVWHRFNDQFITFSNVSRVQCTGFCDQHLNCLSLNYNINQRECELNEDYPVEMSTNYKPEAGWRTYYSYSAVYDRDLTTGATAWQSSTHTSGRAELALDGNTQGNYFDGSCTHTEYPEGAFWAMEFGTEGPVGRIVFYFRSDCCSVRNTEIYFLVSRSRHDVDNDIGTMCSTYIGPPSDLRVPATIICDTFAYGRYLKVIQGTKDKNLSICEIYVYTE